MARPSCVGPRYCRVRLEEGELEQSRRVREHVLHLYSGLGNCRHRGRSQRTAWIGAALAVPVVIPLLPRQQVIRPRRNRWGYPALLNDDHPEVHQSAANVKKGACRCWRWIELRSTLGDARHLMDGVVFVVRLRAVICCGFLNVSPGRVVV